MISVKTKLLFVHHTIMMQMRAAIGYNYCLPAAVAPPASSFSSAEKLAYEMQPEKRGESDSTLCYRFLPRKYASCRTLVRLSLEASSRYLSSLLYDRVGDRIMQSIHKTQPTK